MSEYNTPGPGQNAPPRSEEQRQPDRAPAHTGHPQPAPQLQPHTRPSQPVPGQLVPAGGEPVQSLPHPAQLSHHPAVSPSPAPSAHGTETQFPHMDRPPVPDHQSHGQPVHMKPLHFSQPPLREGDRPLPGHGLPFRHNPGSNFLHAGPFQMGQVSQGPGHNFQGFPPVMMPGQPMLQQHSPQHPRASPHPAQGFNSFQEQTLRDGSQSHALNPRHNQGPHGPSTQVPQLPSQLRVGGPGLPRHPLADASPQQVSYTAQQQRPPQQQQQSLQHPQSQTQQPQPSQAMPAFGQFRVQLGDQDESAARATKKHRRERKQLEKKLHAGIVQGFRLREQDAKAIETLQRLNAENQRLLDLVSVASKSLGEPLPTLPQKAARYTGEHSDLFELANGQNFEAFI